MAHNFESGFFVKQPAWHGLGNLIQEAPSVREGIIQAGLQWDVTTKPLYMADGREVTHKAVVREDNQKIMGVVGPNWTPLQNMEAFDFFDSFLDTGEVSLESAGSLKEGRIVWVLAKIKRGVGEVLKNDPIERYFLLSNGHDGKRAVSLGFTDVRVVCQNTLNLAEASEASKLIRVIHSKNVKQNTKEIKSIIDFSNERFVADMDKLKRLTKSGINQKDIAKYVQMLFFSEKELTSTRATNKLTNIVQKIEELIENGAGADIPGVKGTKYGLYNATTEYLTHYITEDTDKRMSMLWFGKNKELNQKALELLLTA